MLDRIKLLMDAKELTASQFADGMDVPRAVLSHILSGRNKPSLDVVLKIASTHTDVNLEWLLLGKGEMLNSLAHVLPENTSDATVPVAASSADSGNEASIKHVEKVQENKVVSADEPVSSTTTRVVRQVMFFYSDGTFESFAPSN